MASQESSEDLTQRSVGSPRSLMSRVDDISAPVPSRERIADKLDLSTGLTAFAEDPPIFVPAPRDYVVSPRDEIDLVPPPPVPVRPSISLARVLIPLMMGIFVILLLSLLTPGGAILSVLPIGQGAVIAPLDLGSIMTMIISVITIVSLLYNYFDTIYKYVQERGAYQSEVAQRKQSYRAYLTERRQRLEQLRAEQLQANLTTHPSLEECLARAAKRLPRLWERAPGDADFLDVRLGTGRGLPSFTLKSSRVAQQLPSLDPLLQEARNLADEYATVGGLPVTLALSRLRTVGVAGPTSTLHNAVRGMLIQLAAHHAPSDLKIVLVFSQSDWNEWVWARWLPHVWSDDRSRRFLADTPESAYQLLSDISDMIKERQHTSDLSGARTTPAVVFVLAGDDEEIAHFPGMSRLIGSLTRSNVPDVYTIFVADRPEGLPRSCRGVVELETQAGRLRIAGPTPLEQEFAPDTIDSPHAREFACSLAPLRLPSQTDLSGLPSTVSLFEVLGIQRVEDVPVAELWRKHSASETLAVPVGLRRGGGDLILDLHERSQGPHALVAGIAGVGKSVLLQSLIASLAVHYHPHDIAFILIDFKGDGVASLFQNLPHQVGIITTTAGGMTARALSTLQQIIQRRQDLFRQAGVNDIDSYIRAYRQQKTGAPLPHLVVVIDEFHDLAQTYPDFMSELIKIVQSNRALGVHLLLSTARPAEIIDERIWNSVRLRLCLRTEHIDDSQRVIGRDVAAELGHPGRGYILVNRSDTFDLFQAAWAGGPYYPNGDTSQLVEVDEVDLSGRRRRLGPPPPESGQSQLGALVALLKQVAEQERVTSVIGPWLSPPSETVTIESLRRGAAEGWDGNYWQPSSGWLTPIVGLVDDPVRRFQGPLHVALDEGPLALLGVAEAGKTTLLKSVIASLALSHTPSQVHLYILDFGEYLGRIFAELPHAVCATLPDQADELAKVVYTVLVELGRRKHLLASVGVETLTAYRKHTGDTIADIIVILEHYPQFVALYPALTSSLERLVNEGGRLGIHLIMTAHDEAEIPTWLLTRIGLTMMLDGPTLDASRDASGQPVAHPSARTLLRRKADPNAALLPFQKALPAAGATDSDRNEALRGSAKAMASAWHGPTARDGLHEPDLFDGYERGLRQLLSQLQSTSQEYSDALIYQQRLLENIEQSRLYGDTEERVADRAEIIHRLNELVRLTLGTSFNALCGLLNATTF